MNRKMMILGAVAVLAVMSAVVSWRSHRHAPTVPAEAGVPRRLYQCAMHPEIVRDQPGECPICHMRLQLMETGGPEEAGPRKVLFYRHPMRPEVTSPNPSKDEMGMDYVPVYEEGGPAGTAVPGRAAFKVSPERRQLIGVTLGEAAFRDLEHVIRASARVAYDPELYAAVEEYRQLQRGTAAAGEAGDAARSLLRSVRLKLKLMGLGDAQIDALAGQSPEEAASLVLGRAGGKVWVYADVYAFEVNLVKPGQTMDLTTPALPGEIVTGRISAVDPVINPMTRTMRVRAEVENPEGRLKPEMYLEARIRVPLGRRLSVPNEAVLDTGENRYVFVSGEGGTFEPRAVTLGPSGEGFVEVRSGLAAGEQVATSANFLIDSESRVQAALKAFGMPKGHQH